MSHILKVWLILPKQNKTFTSFLKDVDMAIVPAGGKMREWENDGSWWTNRDELFNLRTIVISYTVCSSFPLLKSFMKPTLQSNLDDFWFSI